MAPTPRYNRLQADVKNVEKGYGNVAYVAFKEEFETIAKPTATPVTQEDINTITEDHTFLTNTPPYGFSGLYSRPKDNQASGTTVGEIGTLTDTHTHTFFLPGDDAAVKAQIDKIKNKESIWLVQDAASGKMIQYGDEITPAYVQKVDFTSGNQLGEGDKGYKIDIFCVKKYWYEGVITKQS